MKKFLLLLTAVSISLSIHAQTETELITSTLNDYIEGSTNGQPGILKTAFHPDLNLYSIRNGRLSIWSGVEYIKDTKEGVPTGESGKILSIDFENDVAVAKVEISNPKSTTPYIDYFMLLKIDDSWTVVHKMYTRKSSSNSDTEKNLINKPLMDYIEGTSNGNQDQVRKAFHKDLNLYSIRNGQLRIWFGQDYINGITEGRATGRTGEILFTDFENDIAIAKAKIIIPNRDAPFIDYFLMAKIEGNWSIIHKGYTIKTLDD